GAGGPAVGSRHGRAPAGDPKAVPAQQGCSVLRGEGKRHGGGGRGGASPRGEDDGGGEICRLRLRELQLQGTDLRPEGAGGGSGGGLGGARNAIVATQRTEIPVSTERQVQVVNVTDKVVEACRQIEIRD